MRFVGPALLFVVVAAVYAPSYRNGFIYDDNEVILNHPGIRSAADVVRIFGERHFPSVPYYRPVTRTTLLLQKALHGENPGPFHAANTLLMGLAAVLAYSLLRLEVFGGGGVPAFVAAAVFALHPVASSCVYPVSSGRETLLPAVWTLACLYAYLRAGWKWRTLAYATFAGALFSKEQAVVLPVLFLLADALKLSAEPPRRSNEWVRRYLPLAPVMAIYFVVRHRLFGGQEYAFGSVTGPLWSVAHALQTIVAPFADLVYEPTRELWFSLPRFLLALAAASALVILAVRRRLGSKAVFWLGWFFVTLLPTANILKQEAPFDERYLFLPSLAMCAVAAALAGTQSRWPAVAGIACAVACAVVSAHRTVYFKDDVTFSAQWLRTNPDNANAHFNMGFARARLGEWDAAISHYEEALRLRLDLPSTHNNLGNALLKTGRAAAALAHFDQALRLDPNHADAHLNLGLALARLDRIDEAIGHFRQALRIKPNLAEAHNNLGIAFATRGDVDRAVTHFEAALRIRPEAADVHNNLANALVARARYVEAIDHYREALRLQPDYPEARRNLETVLKHLSEPR